MKKLTLTKYHFLADNFNYSNTDQVRIAAEVGLLTRNIKIEGGEYPDMDKEAFGGRVIVGQVDKN